MQVKPLGNNYLVRLDPGEEAIEHVTRVADQYRIGFATFHGIGTFERVTLGYYDLDARAYQDEVFEEPVEVLAVTGNIATDAAGQRIVHAHVTVGLSDFTTRGGHLVEGIVGPTLEVIIDTGPATIRRRHDEDTGLQLWDLEAIETLSV